jgi:D-inositol-3-phosphate glycosyltransferase
LRPSERVVVSEVYAHGTGLDAARVRRRAALLARTGGGVLISPVIGGERVLYPGLRHHPLRVAPGLSAEALSAEVAARTGEVLDALRPRLVHAIGVSTAVPALLRRRGGVRVVVEPGLLPSQWLRDHEPKLPAERLTDMVGLEDRTLARADAVVARSLIEGATLVARGVAHERIHTALDGVPIGVEAGPPPDLPNVLYIGDAAPWSGHRVPLDALARVHAPWRLTVVTPADAPGGLFEAQARSLRVSERLTVSRDPSFENLVSRLTGSAVVICPLLHTRGTEGGGIVPEAALWALAAGRPLVASDLPVVRSYAGPAARYFDPGDADQLAVHLRLLLGDGAVRRGLAADALAVAASLSWEETERPVADLWETVLES